MIKIQDFSPDTCNCRVQEQWDDAVPDNQRTFECVSIINRGDEHAAIGDSATLYATIKEENRRKNLAFNKAVELAGFDATPDRVAWSFTPGRTLQLSFPTGGVSNNIKTQIQSWCDNNLGLSLVEVL